MSTFSSFSDLGKAFNITQKGKKERPFRCRKCGWVMKHIEGTNVFICDGIHSDGKECGNVVFTKTIA